MQRTHKILPTLLLWLHPWTLLTGHSCSSSTLKLCCGALHGASLLYGCQQILHAYSQCGVLVISGRQSSFQQNYPSTLFGDLRFSGLKAALVILLPLPHTSRKHPYFAMKALAGLVSGPPLCTQLLSVLGVCRLKQAADHLLGIQQVVTWRSGSCTRQIALTEAVVSQLEALLDDDACCTADIPKISKIFRLMGL